ncbi:uncharacterized protein [Panulirus ornatus]|uniref:uncharacterized protein isoform X1 n=1 Tax=Panulirus ornatus TaxID=150431 RepID=UPI003A89237F
MRKGIKLYLWVIPLICVWLPGGRAIPRNIMVFHPPHSFPSRWQEREVMWLKHAPTWLRETATWPTQPTQTTPLSTEMKQRPAKSDAQLDDALSQPFYIHTREEVTISSSSRPSSTSRDVTSVSSSPVKSLKSERRIEGSHDEEASKEDSVYNTYQDFSVHRSNNMQLQYDSHEKSMKKGMIPYYNHDMRPQKIPMKQATRQYIDDELSSTSRPPSLAGGTYHLDYYYGQDESFQRPDDQKGHPSLSDDPTRHPTMQSRSRNATQTPDSTRDYPRPSDSSIDHRGITGNVLTATDGVFPLPVCCDHHYQICSRLRDHRPDDNPGAPTARDPGTEGSSNTFPPPSGEPEAGSQQARHSTPVCPWERSYHHHHHGETEWTGSGGEVEDPGPIHCAHLDWCVVDVWHRAHTCINGNLYQSPWHTRMTITVCMNFPSEIWVRKSSTEVALKVFFMLPIILVGTVANTTILYLLCRNRRLRTTVNLFVGNLAVADLLLAAVCPTLFMLEDFYQHYILGPVGCRLQGFIQTFLMMVSVLSLAMVSGERLAMVTGERLMAVTTPHSRRLSTKCVVAACCLVWLLGAIVASPLIIHRYFVDRLWLDYEETFCSEKPWLMKEYWPYLVVILIWIPMVFLVVSYMVIFCKLDQYEATLRGRGHPVTRRRRRRLLSLMFIILLVFLVCYTPYTVFLIVRAVVVQNHEEVDIYFDILWWMSHWLAYLNSAINPLIYGLTNEGFRRAWHSTCSICLPRKRAVTPASNDQSPSHRAPSFHAAPNRHSVHRTPLVIEALRGTSEYFLEYQPSYMHKVTMYPPLGNMATMDSMAF